MQFLQPKAVEYIHPVCQARTLEHLKGLRCMSEARTSKNGLSIQGKMQHNSPSYFLVYKLNILMLLFNNLQLHTSRYYNIVLEYAANQ